MGLWQWLFGNNKGSPGIPDAPIPSIAPSAPALPQRAPEPPPQPPPTPRYGVDEALALMRALPLDDDTDLVLRVVRKTLRSTGVSVEELIASARNRELAFAGSIANDHEAIAQLERDIAARRKHIEEVTVQLKETETLRQRLQEALENESKIGTLIPPHEMMRLQAEHAAAASRQSSAPSPAVVGTSEVPPVRSAPAPAPPVPSVVPAPKLTAPPLKVSTAPKPPAPPSRPAKPPEAPVTADSAGPRDADEPVPFDSDVRPTINGPPSEPTMKVVIDPAAASATAGEPPSSPSK